MAKEAPALTVTVDNSAGSGKNISNDITSVTMDTPRGLIDVTGLDVASFERLAGLGDGTVTLNGVFNDAADKSHAIFKDIATSAAIRTVLLLRSGQLLTMEILFTSYNVNRGTDGGLTWTATGQLAAVTSFGWTTP